MASLHGAYQAQALHELPRVSDLYKLCTKLCRELAQSEHSATVHTRREARRLGPVPPAAALLAIAQHADSQRPRFESLMVKRQPVGLRLGRGFGELFSRLRHALFDRLIDTERSFRGTLLGLRHGVDVVRLLREVALRTGDTHLMRFCDEWLDERHCHLEHAEQTLAYFAEQPARALQSGLRIALTAGRN
ncbi:MAG: hypothetical protein M3680_01125 [Myxococcota bacterium]|nr:hypothetical protein [Myxococcota bacterium]